jgi:hypothetical protein
MRVRGLPSPRRPLLSRCGFLWVAGAAVKRPLEPEAGDGAAAAAAAIPATGDAVVGTGANGGLDGGGVPSDSEPEVAAQVTLAVGDDSATASRPRRRVTRDRPADVDAQIAALRAELEDVNAGVWVVGMPLLGRGCCACRGRRASGARPYPRRVRGLVGGLHPSPRAQCRQLPRAATAAPHRCAPSMHNMFLHEVCPQGAGRDLWARSQPGAASSRPWVGEGGGRGGWGVSGLSRALALPCSPARDRTRCPRHFIGTPWKQPVGLGAACAADAPCLACWAVGVCAPVELGVVDRSAKLLEGVRALECDRQDRVQQAQAVRDWQIQSTNNLFEYQKYAAGKVFEVRRARGGWEAGVAFGVLHPPLPLGRCAETAAAHQRRGRTQPVAALATAPVFAPP